MIAGSIEASFSGRRANTLPLRGTHGNSIKLVYKGLAMARRLGSQHLDAFQAIVATGSMTKAARERHTSQPQISRLVGQLEDIVGFAVFARKGTRISLSPEGARLYAEIEKHYIGIASVEAAAADIRSFTTEHIRFVAMPRLAGGLLSRAVACLKHEHPETRVSIHVAGANALQERIKAGIDDIGLVMSYGQLSSEVDTIPIATLPCVCVLPPGHSLSRSAQISAADLAAEDLITFVRGSSLAAAIDGYFAQSGVQPRIVAETELGASACALVAAGIGVSLMNPIAALEESQKVDLVVRPLRAAFTATLALMYAHRLRHGLLLKRFGAYIRADLANSQGCM